MDSQQPTLATCRSRIPTDINIRSISSHVQAEALVQCAQQSILDMEAEEDFEPLSTGLTPLSAKLAAYGESLALERRLKRAEEERNRDPCLRIARWQLALRSLGTAKGAVGVVVYTIYVRWSRLGPLASLA